MKVGVISDSHDQIHYIKEVVSELNARGVDLAVHCGDIVAPFTLPYFAKLHCPLKVVFGNNDGDRLRHIQVANNGKFNFEFEARFLNFSLGKRKIAVFHGDYQEIVDSLVSSQKWDAVFHGHTHVSSKKKEGKTLSLNPGSFLDETSEKIKGASYAVYDAETNQAEIINLTKIHGTI